MKERPILFSGPMVRAILEGRKAQTRRVIPDNTLERLVRPQHPAFLMDARSICPYGRPGDRLWVRETFWIEHDKDLIDDRLRDCGVNLKDDEWAQVKYCSTDATPDWDFFSKRPAIHMPRWASRLTLEITGVRVERLQDISEADARAEGVLPNWCGDLADFDPERDGFLPWWPKDGEESVEGVDPYDTLTAKEAYAMLWDSINGKKPGASWKDNPFVWVVEFKRLEAAQ